MQADKNKAPGILIENILLLNSSFKRAVRYDEKFKSDVGVAQNINFSDDKKQVSVAVSLTLSQISDSTNEAQVEIIVEYVGLFRVDENAENLDLKEFAKFNAVATIFPYIRQHIHDLSLKAALPTIVLPPVNIYKLLQDSPTPSEK